MDDLTPQQLQAVLLLANGVRPTAVAKKIGVDRVTVWQWRKDETFKLAVAEFAADSMTSARNAGSYLMPKAMRRLAKIIESESAEAPTPGDQIAAIKLLLEFSTNWHLIEPIERAKRELEARLQAEEHR